MARLGANLIVLLCFLLMVGTFSWLLAKRRLASDIVAAKAGIAAERDRLRSEHRELVQRARPAAPGPAKPDETPPSSRFSESEKRAQAIVDLHRSGLLGMRPWPDPARNSLSAGIADVASMLGLTESETAALQQVAEAGRQEFAAALKARASVVREGSTAMIAVADAPEARAAYDRMLAALRMTLGPKRYGYYEALGARDAIERLFDRWGRQGTEIKVAHATAPPAELYPSGSVLPREGRPTDSLSYYYTHSTATRPTIMLSRTGQAQPPREFGGGVISGTQTIEGLRTNIGPLADLIPPDL